VAVDSGNRKKYDFKHVGDQYDDWEIENPIIPNEVPIGFKTPMELGQNHEGPFKMHTILANQIVDNFRNMLMTNHGERLGMYYFGANLSNLCHELGSELQDTEAIRRIRKTTKKYMPYIEPRTFESFIERFDNQHVAKVGIRIIFDIPTLQIRNKAVEVILHTTG
jgi:phage baseplate assembly protein W